VRVLVGGIDIGSLPLSRGLSKYSSPQPRPHCIFLLSRLVLVALELLRRETRISSMLSEVQERVGCCVGCWMDGFNIGSIAGGDSETLFFSFSPPFLTPVLKILTIFSIRSGSGFGFGAPIANFLPCLRIQTESNSQIVEMYLFIHGFVGWRRPRLHLIASIEKVN